jgi:hypothetical protein
MLDMPIMEAITPNDPVIIGELLRADSQKLIQEIILGFPTAAIITHHEDVDGSLNIYTENIRKELIRGWKKDGRAQGDEFEFGRIKLTVEDFMVNLELTFNERKIRAYRHLLEITGRTADEYSLVMYLTERARVKMARESGIGFWQGKAVSGAAQDAPLRQKIDGIRRQAKALAANNIARTNAFGVITKHNAIEAVEGQYDILPDEMKENGSVTFCGFTLFDKYKKNFKTENKQNAEVLTIANAPYNNVLRLEHGNGTHYLLPSSEFGDDDALLTTDPKFLSMGHKQLMDWKTLDLGRQLMAMTDFSVGALIEQRNEGYVVVNDVLVANS